MAKTHPTGEGVTLLGQVTYWFLATMDCIFRSSHFDFISRAKFSSGNHFFERRSGENGVPSSRHAKRRLEKKKKKNRKKEKRKRRKKRTRKKKRDRRPSVLSPPSLHSVRGPPSVRPSAGCRSVSRPSDRRPLVPPPPPQLRGQRPPPHLNERSAPFFFFPLFHALEKQQRRSPSTSL